MTSPATQPGWYPAPDGSGAPWWWDGSQWVQPTVGAPMGKPVGRLASAVQVLLISTVALTLGSIAVDAFGVMAVSAYLDGDFDAADSLVSYDTLAMAVNIPLFVALLATGVLWVIWQHRLATRAHGRTRRSPAWHVWSWIIPVIAFWFPYQNVSDLWRAAGRTRPSWQIAWWLLWIAGGFFGAISSQMGTRAETLDELLVSMLVGIISSVLTLAAAPFAVRLVRELTQASA
ncbi:DUF4328 domain-containing protein [uncultured Microbacterium sp.]|uniref:DUF4328 domain-containing protein n=1 Tax=uncultured Microbacterium sp. TaxID=191216 RepID=UPI0028DB186C|nr:DUF4328 domain-containing protein [uncultured Microbacterium sp.]